MVFTIAYWEGGRQVVLQIRRRYQDPQETFTRNIWQLLWVTLWAVVVSIFLGATFNYVFPYTAPDALRRGLIAGLTTTYIIVSFYEIAYIYNIWHRTQMEKEQYKKDAIQAQLHGLRAQVNPHFLFNSLNSLIYLIPEDQKKAVHFVQKLSNVYRYILETRDTELISVREELSFLEAYRFLLKVRFEENLSVHIDIPEAYQEHLILPLSLQLLLENAIKHNIISDANPLAINLKVHKEYLEIRNNLQKKSSPMESTGTGLENVRRRYQFFTPKTVVVQETAENFTVRIPLLSPIHEK
ncbi:MAG: histidine kinase [Bacteroidota bacterium]